MDKVKRMLRDVVDSLSDAEPDEIPELLGELARGQTIMEARLLYPRAEPKPGSVATNGDRLLSMAEVAQRLGVSVYTAREMGRRGKLPTTKVGRHVGIRESTLRRVMEEGEEH